MSETNEQNLSVGRNLKIGLFHLGSGMADVISTGIWNRIMISDLGFSATPIGLLVSLRYFLAPLGVWAGRMSDRHQIGGYRRLFWVWLGRAMMVVSIAGLGLMTAQIARGSEVSLLTWVVITLSLLLFSLGNAFSGSTFLALIYDRAGTHQRGRAVGIVWTFLLLGFTIGGVLFGILLPPAEQTSGLGFSPDTLQNLFLLGAAVMGSLWFVSVVGEERRYAPAAGEAAAAPPSSLRDDLKLAWSNRRTRFFCWYLALSMLFAFSQDLILEPFAGDVFKMDAHITNRFSAYWGSMSILGTIVFLVWSRRSKRLTNTVMSSIGVGVLVLTFAVFALSAFAGIRGLVTPGLILLGIGLGVWNVGTLGLMMEMSPFGRAGTFLGFWTLVVTLARGIGVSGGGLVRDVGMALTTNNYAAAYGLVFLIGGLGLGVSLWTLSQVKVKAFQAEVGTTEASTEKILAAALD
ncbi:MAG TPA: BCD family MFS transporter [Phototrophicaceae bacterium]|nr:BCD family MFS transporter [Phototrophicaceae bacterium]